jgi:hypothetical protein
MASKWDRENVKIENELKTVVINKRPWVYIDLSGMEFSPFRTIVCLAFIVDLLVIIFTAFALISMLNGPLWFVAGQSLGWLMGGEVAVLFFLFIAYALSVVDW